MSKLFSIVMLCAPLAFFQPTFSQPSPEPAAEPSVPSRENLDKFAMNVTLHVVLHEMGHALVREFDLPVLGNEETLADAFATHYVIHHLPDRAVDVIHARVRSLMIEAKEVPRNEWTVEGEHNSDARRAYQIVSLAIAAKPDQYTALAKEIGVSDNAIDNARDYGTEIHRSWRRILRPLMMPAGKSSAEARLAIDRGSKFGEAISGGQLAIDIRSAIESIDWHSQVSVFFAEGEGGAGWSRSKRTITVRDGYVERFVEQGKQPGAKAAK